MSQCWQLWMLIGMRDPGENRSVLSVYSPWSVRRMVWDFLLPLGKGVWRAVGFRRVNRNMGEGRVLTWHCMWLVGFMGVVYSPPIPVEFQCPMRHLFPVSHVTCC